MPDPNLAPHFAGDTKGELSSDTDVEELVFKGLGSLFGDDSTATLTRLEDGSLEIDFGHSANPEAKAS